MNFRKNKTKGLIIIVLSLLGVFGLFALLSAFLYNTYDGRYSESDSYAFAQINDKVYYCNSDGVCLYDGTNSSFVCEGNSIKALGEYLVVNNSLVRKNELYLYNTISQEKISIRKGSFGSYTYVKSFFVKDTKVYYFVHRSYNTASAICVYDTSDGTNKTVLREKGVYSMAMDEDAERLFLLKDGCVCMLDLEGNLLKTIGLKLSAEDGRAFEICADGHLLYVETNDNFYVYNTDDLSREPVVISSSKIGGHFYLLSAKNSVAYGVKYQEDSEGLVVVSVDTKDSLIIEHNECVFTDDILKVSSYRPAVMGSKLWFVNDDTPQWFEP